MQGISIEPNPAGQPALQAAASGIAALTLELNTSLEWLEGELLQRRKAERAELGGSLGAGLEGDRGPQSNMPLAAGYEPVGYDQLWDYQAQTDMAIAGGVEA